MIKITIVLFISAVISIVYAAGLNYSGSWPVYLVFSLVANALLMNGFRRRALFFDTFIGLFLWLGFWLKFSLRTAFNQAAFGDALAFDGSPSAFDHALIVSSCGLAALLFSSVVRERFFVYPNEAPACGTSGLLLFYRRYRLQCVSVFLAMVVLVAFSNSWLGIYQRGMVAQTVLPYGLNGVYKWLLQFGLASLSALIIRFEIELNRNLTLMAIVPALLESFLSNVSLLSRGMILNSAGLVFGGLRLLLSMNVRVGFLRIVAIFIAFMALFMGSVLAVNFLRATAYEGAVAVSSKQSAPSAATIKAMTVPLFLDRWVGIEGVVAVSLSKDLGWGLWKEAWQERFRDGELSIYDRKFIDSPYTSNVEKPKFHFVSLPGIVAFLYFPGSLVFLFIALVFCGLLAATIEIATYHYAGQNWILCSLVAQVVAYRYAHFGYVPAQSYLLFGTLIANVAILFTFDQILRRHLAAPDK
jgi:hypothetical protein